MSDMRPFTYRGFAKGVITHGDPADLPANSMQDGENGRLDLTGDVSARPGTGLVTLAVAARLPDGCVGPLEYSDATGKSAEIFADTTGGIWEVNNGATKIAQFPFTGAQSVTSTDKSQFGRLYFCNGEDVPHYLVWVPLTSTWAFREVGYSSVPAGLTLSAIAAGNTFGGAQTARTSMAYQPESNGSFLLRRGNRVDRWFEDLAWATGAEAPTAKPVPNDPYNAGTTGVGGPMAYHGLLGQFLISGGYLNTDAAATAPIPLGDVSRKCYTYDRAGNAFGPLRTMNGYRKLWAA